jgi:uncharacterized membrane protein YphA (DoxX/SURF4 family)
MSLFIHFSRIFVGLLFIISGLIKLNDPVGTSIKLQEYFEVFAADFGSFFHVFVPASLFLAMLLNVLEVILGFALLIRYRFRLTIWVLMAVIVFFTFLTFYSAYFNKVTDCGCFGDAIKLTPWQSFFKDIILLFFIGVLFLFRKRLDRDFNYPQRDWWMIGTTAVLVWLGIYAINHLPFIDFRAYKVGTNIPEAMQPSAKLEYEYVMIKDGEEYRLKQYPKDPDYEFKELVVLNPEAQPKITDYSLWNDDGEFTQISFEGQKLLIIIHEVGKTNKDSFDDINHLLSSLGPGIQPMVLTAADYASYDRFRHEVQLAVPFYYADMTVLKTIVRSNPGIVLLQEGTVRGKWHFHDVPSIAEINELL